MMKLKGLLKNQKKPQISNITIEDENLFQQSVGKVKPLKVDTIHFDKKLSKSKNNSIRKKHQRNSVKDNKSQAEFYFSDDFEPNLNTSGPMKYVRSDVGSFEAKNLRRSVYKPDLILDLHGLDQRKAKQEIAALLYACQKEQAQCICIIHGLGSKVLKNKVPHWLVQHPDVMAFHQAPLEWGGNGALLALIELKGKYNNG